MKKENINNFDRLVCNITNIQDALQAQAVHAINLALTVRNWLIGYYIVEYEQNGEDRAQYGEQLLKKLAKKINKKGLEERRLYEFRRMYTTYPYLSTEIAKYLESNVNNTNLRMLSAKSKKEEIDEQKLRTASAILKEKTNSMQILRLPTTELPEWATDSRKLFNKLNFSSLLYLSGIADPLKRAFYEQESINGCWTVKELDRQVSSLYYERLGLSKNQKALQKQLAKNNKPIVATDIIRDPVSLEFLGLQSQDVFTETKLETAIPNHLQQFLLEMGSGFCFEARQKRILVDNDYYKADLIFYHRILKCHIIVDLKIDRFKHEYASQLNLYLNYFKHEIMCDDDNPPIGLLLCTDYGETTVKYATEGLSQNLFVSKYQIQLPSENEIRNFLMENIPKKEYKNE